MFSCDLDRINQPLWARVRGIVIGSSILISVTAALVSARSTPFSFAATLGIALVTSLRRGAISQLFARPTPILQAMGFFLLYAALSAFWAVDPMLSLRSVALLGMLILGTLALVRLFAHEFLANLLHMSEGLWIGFLIGLTYLLIETLSGQSLKIWLYNTIGISAADLKHPGYFLWSGGRLISVSLDDLKHSIAPIPVFLWPTLLALRISLPREWRMFAAAGLVLVAGVTVFLATHGSSKTAFIAGFITFLGALWALHATARAVKLGWLVLCFAVLPAVLVAHRIDLHNAHWLGQSTRHRIIIWNHTAEQALRTPIRGMGANSTYVLGPQLRSTTVNSPGEALERTLAQHAHNIYLQTWFELGLVGIVLLSIVGLSVLDTIAYLKSELQPYAYATFVSATVTASSSYGLWQIWFLAMFGFAASFFALASSLALKSDFCRETDGSVRT